MADLPNHDHEGTISGAPLLRRFGPSLWVRLDSLAQPHLHPHNHTHFGTRPLLPRNEVAAQLHREAGAERIGDGTGDLAVDDLLLGEKTTWLNALRERAPEVQSRCMADVTSPPGIVLSRRGPGESTRVDPELKERPSLVGGSASAVNREISPLRDEEKQLGRLCFRWDAVEATSASSGEVPVAGDVAPIIGLPRRTCREGEGEGARWDAGWRVLLVSRGLVWSVIQRLVKRDGEVWISEGIAKAVSGLQQDCSLVVLG
ncbi:hypothetical protein CPLU01_08319 [Colletotrichum plurivorum]|uniref:Uncharacterized protein n=1 Tax=Colletotrichum plurivorum TaxID=2175906 RepID=A0A8H6NDD7_9PEZI|nr:hypothetical protein CPLU01_08319 [Colletotrichum plurivorum]